MFPKIDLTILDSTKILYAIFCCHVFEIFALRERQYENNLFYRITIRNDILPRNLIQKELRVKQ